MSSISIRVDTEVYQAARNVAKAECRSIAQQIEFWARIGKAALENPDLPIDFVRDMLISKAQDSSLATPFVPESQP